MQNSSKHLLQVTLILALFASSPLQANAQSSNIPASKNVSYSGKLGTASAGISIKPVISTNGNQVEYGTSYNTYTNASLSGPRGASLSGSGSTAVYVSSSGSGSGTSSSNYTASSANGASVMVQTNGTISTSAGTQSYNGNGSATGSNGNVYSWSCDISHTQGSSANGSIAVSKNNSQIKTVTF